VVEEKPKETMGLELCDVNPILGTDEHANVTCFNCVEWGHFSIDWKDPKLCFIYQTASHVGRDGPEWKKPLEPTQYLGSVAQGLGFSHVVVAILRVEEGQIDEEEIVLNLHQLFDPHWHWQRMEVEEFKYLVRFLPHKQIDATLICDTIIFEGMDWRL
jgi:hypothetical protein